ncbi:MAG: hypothetical protein B7C24_16505 [Bacteroidetes bacterium 4572_77]|nr:MAG: hypothetical protein B7C24_16505 [Bacteroidetes bacterium 4572_77]
MQQNRYDERMKNRLELFMAIDERVAPDNTLGFLPPENKGCILSATETAIFLVEVQRKKKKLIMEVIFSPDFSNMEYRTMYDKSWAILTQDFLPKTSTKLSAYDSMVLTPLTVVNTISWDIALGFLKV